MGGSTSDVVPERSTLATRQRRTVGCRRGSIDPTAATLAPATPNTVTDMSSALEEQVGIPVRPVPAALGLISLAGAGPVPLPKDIKLEPVLQAVVTSRTAVLPMLPAAVTVLLGLIKAVVRQEVAPPLRCIRLEVVPLAVVILQHGVFPTRPVAAQRVLLPVASPAVPALGGMTELGLITAASVGVHLLNLLSVTRRGRRGTVLIIPASVAVTILSTTKNAREAVVLPLRVREEISVRVTHSVATITARGVGCLLPVSSVLLRERTNVLLTRIVNPPLAAGSSSTGMRLIPILWL